MAPDLRIALVLNGTEKYDNDILDGFVRFAGTKPEWRLSVRGWSEGREISARGERPDAIVTRSHTAAEMRAMKRMGVPLVNVSSTPVDGVPQVCRDNHAIGVMAAEHLLECGLRHFTFVFLGADASYCRKFAGFRDRLTGVGVSTTCLEWPSRLHKNWSVRREVSLIAAHIRTLPVPLGIFAAESFHGRHVLAACEAIGRHVPGEVAIVGGVDDDLVCLACHPQLSSIKLGAGRVGYDAGALLSKLIDGGTPPRDPILIPPLRVVVRQSTEVWATSDPVLADALHFLRTNACRGMTTKELLRDLPRSRRWVETSVRKTLGRTLAEEIRRCQLARARELLDGTDASMKEVAAACGYRNAMRFSANFQRWTGVSPSEYRRRSSGVR